MSFSRYHRQEILPQVGPAGQAQLRNAAVLVIGCGALGCQSADQLARAGVGLLRITDRDLVERTNLQRQTLFSEADADDARPKALAAVDRLRSVNSDITIEPAVVDVDPLNIQELVHVDRIGGRPFDVIVDGTDNVATRYLINDVAVRYGIPWVYGACVGTGGRAMGVIPGRTPCLRCVFPTAPAGDELPTCDTAGILGAAAAVVASWQAALTLKLLIEPADQFAPSLLSVDLWQGRFHTLKLDAAPEADCPCCGKRDFSFLNASAGHGASLCGRDAVQVYTGTNRRLDLSAVAGRLESAGQVQSYPYFVRCNLNEPSGITLTVFPDGRVIVAGLRDPARARAICARFIGA